MPPESTRTPPTTDGRSARRLRGRAAVIDAALDLLLESGVSPSPESVAKRAGVSVSSLFRYFESVAELQAEAVSTFRQRHQALFELSHAGQGTLPQRVDHLIEQRLHQYATVAPLARLARARAGEHAPFAHALTETRQVHLAQIHHHFAAELAAATPEQAADTALTLAMLTSFEAWDTMQGDLGRSSDEIARLWRQAVLTLLS